MLYFICVHIVHIISDPTKYFSFTYRFLTIAKLCVVSTLLGWSVGVTLPHFTSEGISDQSLKRYFVMKGDVWSEGSFNDTMKVKNTIKVVCERSKFCTLMSHLLSAAWLISRCFSSLRLSSSHSVHTSIKFYEFWSQSRQNVCSGN